MSSYYLCFTPSTSDEVARSIFVKRFGWQPKQIFRDSGLLWVGPCQVETQPEPAFPAQSQMPLIPNS